MLPSDSKLRETRVESGLGSRGDFAYFFVVLHNPKLILGQAFLGLVHQVHVFGIYF